MTLDQALNLKPGDEVHVAGCTRSIGPRGGVHEDVVRVRVSGKVKTWKTRPGEFRVPYKYGLKTSGEVTHLTIHRWHLWSDCPLQHTDGPVTAGKGAA